MHNFIHKSTLWLEHETFSAPTPRRSAVKKSRPTYAQFVENAISPALGNIFEAATPSYKCNYFRWKLRPSAPIYRQSGLQRFQALAGDKRQLNGTAG